MGFWDIIREAEEERLKEERRVIRNIIISWCLFLVAGIVIGYTLK